MYEGPGLYEHYKGGRYYVHCVARMEADDSQEFVVYEKAGAGGPMWLRPLQEFDEWIVDIEVPLGTGQFKTPDKSPPLIERKREREKPRFKRVV